MYILPQFVLKTQWFSKCSFKLEVAVSPRNLLEMQIPNLYLQITDSETGGSMSSVLISHSSGSHAHWSLRPHN